MEIWKDVEGYEGIYSISNEGTLMNSRGMVLARNKTKKGRYLYHLSKNGVMKAFLAHRLVAIAFIPNPENKPDINHIDGDPSNNHYSNLEWCTKSENSQHAWDTGLIKPRKFSEEERKSIRERVRIKVVSTNKETNEVMYFDSMTQCAEHFGVSQPRVSLCLKEGRLVKKKWFISRRTCKT